MRVGIGGAGTNSLETLSSLEKHDSSERRACMATRRRGSAGTRFGLCERVGGPFGELRAGSLRLRLAFTSWRQGFAQDDSCGSGSACQQEKPRSFERGFVVSSRRPIADSAFFSTCLPYRRRRVRRPWELSFLQGFRRPELRSSASAMQSNLRSAAPCEQPWSDRARPP
jgi:hypothetical protein